MTPAPAHDVNSVVREVLLAVRHHAELAVISTREDQRQGREPADTHDHAALGLLGQVVDVLTDGAQGAELVRLEILRATVILAHG